MWTDLYLFAGTVDFWGFFPCRIAAAPLQGALGMGVPQPKDYLPRYFGVRQINAGKDSLVVFFRSLVDNFRCGCGNGLTLE